MKLICITLFIPLCRQRIVIEPRESRNGLESFKGQKAKLTAREASSLPTQSEDKAKV